MEFVNLALLREPINWVIVIAMLAIGVYAFHLIYRLAGQLPAPL